MRSLITGVGGFVGQHLMASLLKQPDEIVFGLARGAVEWDRPELAESPRFRLLTAGLADADAVRQAVEIAAPDKVFLLAAMSSPAASFNDPMGTITNNTACVVNVLDALRAVAPRSRIVLVSSGEIYGSSIGAVGGGAGGIGGSGGGLIDEGAGFAPVNPYALSKTVQDLLGYQYHAAYGMDIVRMRPFNHLGPGQTDRFVASAFARQIAEVEAGLRPPVIEVGSLASVRDFTDVRDVVQGYELAAAFASGGEAYNLASGRGTSIKELLDGLLSASQALVQVRHDPARDRPKEVAALLGDARKFSALTGWRPTIALDQTLHDILDDWRRRVNSKPAGSQSKGT